MRSFPSESTAGRKAHTRFVSNGRTSHFIQSVKLWCKQNHVTQTKLAGELGVSKALIASWFAGRRFPVAEEVLHLQEIMRQEKRKS